MQNLKKVGDNPMRKNSNSDKEVKILVVRHKYISISVSKARRVIDQIRGRSYPEALSLLSCMPYKASYTICKLLHSAAANADHIDLDTSNSYISKAEVNRSTIVKKSRPRAKGYSYPIKRTMCHIKMVFMIHTNDSYISKTKVNSTIVRKSRPHAQGAQRLSYPI